MNTNQKGNRGQIEVLRDLYARGYHVFLPFDDYSAVDLIALSPEGKCVRLQVKYRSLESGAYKLKTRSMVDGKAVEIDRTMINGWAVYLAELDRVVYIDVKALDGKKSLSIDPDEDYNTWKMISPGGER